MVQTQKAVGLSSTVEVPLATGFPCLLLHPDSPGTTPLRQGAALTQAEASRVSPSFTCVQLPRALGAMRSAFKRQGGLVSLPRDEEELAEAQEASKRPQLDKLLRGTTGRTDETQSPAGEAPACLTP